MVLTGTFWGYFTQKLIYGKHYLFVCLFVFIQLLATHASTHTLVHQLSAEVLTSVCCYLLISNNS